MMRTALVAALSSALGAGASWLAFDPVHRVDQAQGAIIGQFVGRYCHPPKGANEDFLMGEAAALSRVSISSGLQPLAWAEYLKCKAGL